MVATNKLPKSAFFDKPDIEIADGEVLLFCTLKNEVQRIPYFLDYYRAQGINHFFVIDNASTDGSREILEAQDDVHLFETRMSYKGSSAGRLWMQELAAHYGMGRWCLTVDVDELLVFPGAEVMSVPQLCDYLDHDGSEGLMCVFLDMYSDKPLSETIYEPGEPFTDVCSWFETDSYILRPGGNPPFLSVFGGPRGKSFLESEAESNGPMMKKVPLVKWHENFTYIFSTHSHSQLHLSRATGALLHFKFFDFFTELAAREHARGDRRQTKDYAHYAQSMTENVCFYGPQSRRYAAPADLVRLGVMAAPRDLRDWAMSVAQTAGPAHQNTAKRAFPKVAADDLGGAGRDFTLRDLGRIWPFVHNPYMWDYFTAGAAVPTTQFTNRRRYMRQMRGRVRILDTDDKGLLFHLPEPLVYQVGDPKLRLVCYAQGQILWQAPLSGNNPRLRIAENALEPMTYRLDCDWQPDADGLLHGLAFYLVAEEQLPEAGLAGSPAGKYSDILGAPLMEVPHMSFGKFKAFEGLERVRLDGVVDRILEGRINGWVRHKDLQDWSYGVAIYIDGQFVTTVTPDMERPDLGLSGSPGLEFRAQLPLGYFYEQGRRDIRLDARVAGANVSLRRMPMKLDGKPSYHWQKRWVADAEPGQTGIGPTRGRPLWRRVGGRVKRALRG